VNEEQRRIRGYLQAQGAKLSPSDVIDKVRAAMAELRAAALAVPAARFEQRPAPEEWSGHEVMAHVVDAGRHFGDQVVAILEGHARPAPAREGPAGTSGAARRTAAEWCAVLERDREALFTRALAAEPTAHLTEPIEHRMFGPLNWRETMLFMRLHDLDHAGQLEKIAAALG
jgi:uncharacterized damage-inducible protein DinB